jgi:7-carboxy-7-deazaguanine synthase
MLNIQSVFDSIDGEANGFLGAGQLTTFIRLKGCNLNCRYCDTKYSQEPTPEKWRSVIEVADQVHFPKVTITGGEPLLQKTAVEALCFELIYNRGCSVSIETNGSIVPPYFMHSLRYIVDYKLTSSGMYSAMKPEVFCVLRKVDVIKFVIADEADYNWAKTLVETKDWPAQKVFSPAITFKNLKYAGSGPVPTPIIAMDWPKQLVEKMIQDKVNASFSLQLHKVLWPGAAEER